MREIDSIYLMEEKRLWHSRELLGNATAVYEHVLAAYDVLAASTNQSSQLWEGRARPLYLLVSACRYDLTMAILALLRGHACDAYYHVRSAVDYAGVMRLMREQPDLETLWVDTDADDAKLKQYRDRAHAAAMFPANDDVTVELKKRYGEASNRIHSSRRSMFRRVTSLTNADADRFDYFDVDKRNPNTLFEPYIWIAETHLFILSLFDGIFGEELAAYRHGWEGTRAAALQSLADSRRRLLNQDLGGRDLGEHTPPR